MCFRVHHYKTRKECLLHIAPDIQTEASQDEKEIS